MCEPSRRYLPGPLAHSPIKVDDFSKGAMVYFLTHAHTDHFHGLRESWNHGRLYCTKVTRELLLLKYPGFNSRLIHTLEIGDTKLIVLDEHFSFCVTILDARHCAGSCMYLFESKHFEGGVRILHTGDFRYECDQLIPPILVTDSSNDDDIKRTCVYLDNTYGLRNSPKNPTRKQVQYLLSQIMLTKYNPRTRFVFALHGLGKEELVAACAIALQTKIYVDQERFESIQCFDEPQEWKDLFTTGGSVRGCRIVCIRRGKQAMDSEESERERLMRLIREEFSQGGYDGFELEEEARSSPPQTEQDGEQRRDTDDLVFITPSGWYGTAAFQELQQILSQTTSFSHGPKYLRVPYSLHASREEIIRFIKQCGFQYVVPIVNISADHVQELDCHHLQRWEHTTMITVEAKYQSSSMFVPQITAHHNRIAASPESHQRRLELKRTRFVKSTGGDKSNEEQSEDIQVVFRRDAPSDWSVDENEILRLMNERRLARDCVGHEQARKRLRRSDYEIFARLTVLRSNGVSSIQNI